MTQNANGPHLTGLTDREVEESRRQHGQNLLTPPKRPSMWRLYLEKFKDPVIKVLLVAACFSLVISVIEGEYAETIGIFFAIFLATGIGFWFEYDANRKFDLLNTVGEETPVSVVRNGKIREIPRKDIVVGDIVILNTGEEVPADGTLLEAVSLQINESNLTGELMVNKTVEETAFDAEATYPSNAVMRGTTVTDGHGVMRVERVGDATEIGKVARQATEQGTERTPLNIQLSRLAKLIGRAGFTIAILTFLIFTGKDLYAYLSVHTVTGWEQWLDIANIVLKYFMMAVTLIVVAVPEGLPMSVTLSLALNMRRMLRTNNLVRKMHACETMGAITVICTDKTGTLTQNLMQVYETQLDETCPDIVAEGIAANSTAFLEEKGEGERPAGVGNPTEVALLLWLQGRGRDYMALRSQARVLDQLTFSTERKYMATLVESPVAGSRVLYVKGAPEIVMSRCTLDEARKREYEEALLAYQNKAMRTLGLAYKVIPADAPTDCAELVAAGGLTFLGIFAISDPIRPDVPDAVRQCQSAGIAVKIVTGDTPGTATEIARQIGLWTPEDTDRNRITGAEFAALSDEEALDRVLDLKVMSRARPMDKQRLVQLLQQKGAVVAVTGDGTNDAPALNHAQVGLSMGTGTSVAKEASDITLLDDSFRSIATAVMWGRSLYRNIQRFVLFQLTINFAAIVICFVGAVFGTEMPLTVVQILWVNIIMDTFAAMAMASLPPSAEVMRDKPRPRDEFIITRAMARTIFTCGMVMVAVLLGMLFWWTVSEGGLSVEQLTLFFSTFVFLQFWNMFNAKGFETRHSVFTCLKGCREFFLILAAIGIGQVLIVEFGGEVFRTVPLTGREWASVIGFTSLLAVGGEAVRAIRRKRQ